MCSNYKEIDWELDALLEFALDEEERILAESYRSDHSYSMPTYLISSNFSYSNTQYYQEPDYNQYPEPMEPLSDQYGSSEFQQQSTLTIPQESFMWNCVPSCGRILSSKISASYVSFESFFFWIILRLTIHFTSSTSRNVPPTGCHSICR